MPLPRRDWLAGDRFRWTRGLVGNGGSVSSKMRAKLKSVQSGRMLLQATALFMHIV